ncbi:hypothetical protein EDB80DRAFT_590178, partial [Ilyonectria destructans]
LPEETQTGVPDPLSISIYILKELIIREWRNEWGPRPAKPDFVKLIFFGELLDGPVPLRCRWLRSYVLSSIHKLTNVLRLQSQLRNHEHNSYGF